METKIKIPSVVQEIRDKNHWCGVYATPIEQLKFSKWQSNNKGIPAFNTIAHEERIEIFKNFLKTIR